MSRREFFGMAAIAFGYVDNGKATCCEAKQNQLSQLLRII